MYQVVIIIQCICIAAVLLEAWVILRTLQNRLHAYLFLSCVATLINSVGYLMELISVNEEEYYMALRASWIGRVWISYSLFFFIVEFCRIKFPYLIRVLLGMINVITYIIIFMTPTTGLYYKNPSFFMNGDFPSFQFEVGAWQTFWRILLIVYIISGISLMIRHSLREKDPLAKKRSYLILTALFVESLCSVIGMIRSVAFFRVYDMSMIGFPIGAMCIFIAILQYKLLDTETLVKNYVIDEIDTGIIAADPDNKIDFYNKTALDVFPDLKGNTSEVLKKMQDSILTGEPIAVSDKLYTPEKSSIERTESGSETIYVLSDSTGHYRHIKELEEQKQIANDANKAKSAFLASMSHEIRTPINAVLGMDEMILRESSEDHILTYASDIQSAGRTLLSLINDILDFSKIEEGKMEIIPTKYELSSVINDLNNMIRERAEKKGLKFIINLDPNSPYLLFGDEKRIRQIVLNLLTNAVKYTKEGSVTLSVGYSRISEAETSLSFKVSDTGIGIKAEDMDRLFSPFERIEEKRNRSIEGTGLGMSIVQQLLSMMDSRLDVKSTYGEGSEFSFSVRQTVMDWKAVGDLTLRLAELRDNKRKYRELFHAPDARVLVIDDTKVNLVVISSLLKKTLLQIDTSNSGIEALNIVKDNYYDVIFIDHMMPDMDGIEVLQKMKEIPSNEGTVYIALTANAISGAREMYIKEGFSDYLSKPVEGIQLEKILLKYLPADKISEKF